MSSIISIDELHRRSEQPVVKLISASERSERAASGEQVARANGERSEQYERKLPVKRAAEAIKDPKDIEKIISYLKDKAQASGEASDWRDYLLFVTGINFGLRASDLLSLHIGDVVDEYGHIVDEILLTEKKTKHQRMIYVNDAVKEALALYFTGINRAVSRSEYLFRGTSNRSKNMDAPLTRRNLERILKRIVNDECGIDVRASTHMLRKTFCYQALCKIPDSYVDKVAFLQKITGHTSRDAVLAYIGVTDDDVRSVVQALGVVGTTASTAVSAANSTVGVPQHNSASVAKGLSSLF